MIDVSKKTKTLRIAVAKATLTCSEDTISRIRKGDIPKGDPIPIAKVAAVQAAKNSSQIIPYCHPMPIEFVGVDFTLNNNSIDVIVTAKAIYRTGVEMEALTAASVAVLTLYDMMKMFDNEMEITGVKLLEKRGGKSEFGKKPKKQLEAAVLVASDSISGGTKSDKSGQIIIERLRAEGILIIDYNVIPDEETEISRNLIRYADELHLDLVITTGGTGFSPRDVTPEAMIKVIEREIPGIPEAVRVHGLERTPYSMLSRAKAGLRGKTLIVNLPGSKKGVAESLDALFPAVLHAYKMIWGGGHEDDKKSRCYLKKLRGWLLITVRYYHQSN